MHRVPLGWRHLNGGLPLLQRVECHCAASPSLRFHSSFTKNAASVADRKDWGFRRFSLRGREKVSLDLNLVCLAYNVRRLHRLGAFRGGMRGGSAGGKPSHRAPAGGLPPAILPKPDPVEF